MEILHDHPLKKHNTFGLEVYAKTFVHIKNVEDLSAALQKFGNEPLFILSGGSNMLLTQNIEQTVLFIDLKGIEIVKVSEEFVEVKAMAGENWHNFVMFTIENDFGGLENLSLIPGNVGTTPIQNIGAYGVEIKETLASCDAMEIKTGKLRTFSNAESKFGYRDSIFKNEYKGQYIIVSATFKLTKSNHKLNIGYGDIAKLLAEQNIVEPNLRDVSNAVISIRKSKLPDPTILGNSGSFFKNPVIEKELYQQAKGNFPEMPGYEVSATDIKVPAGWLIENAGLKGKRWGDAGVHDRQALVLVNHGKASGADILKASTEIQKAVYDKFGIMIEPEVNIF